MIYGEEDLAGFLADFGTPATYNGAAPVTVIHDQAYLEQLGIAGTRPVALGIASVFPAGGGAGGSVGKTLAIGSTTYTIKGREPQDDGAFVLLILES